MMVLGLTGSVAMGKSTTAAMFARAGVPVFAADQAVHELYRGAAVAPVEEAFPGVSVDGAIDRNRLKKKIGDDPAAWRKLETIVHPLVHAAEGAFIDSRRTAGHHLVVLDVPLLLESGPAGRVDAVIVVTAAAAVQRARAFERPGMTEALFKTLLERQMSDADKRARAHFIVDTGAGLDAAAAAVDDILRAVAPISAGR